MANGLTAEEAAEVVGVPRSTLYRWEKAPEPKSRRPHRLRKPAWPPALVQAVEELRADNPMWGKRKLVWLLCAAKASPSPSPPSAASSSISSSAAWSRRCRRCAASPAAAASA